MRMWMCNPKIMCRQHLLGEHREMHTLIGSLTKKRSIEGHIRLDQLEPLSIKTRHDNLVQEMQRRKYKHNSPLIQDESLLNHLPESHRNHRINRNWSKELLLLRCQRCRQLNEQEENKND